MYVFVIILFVCGSLHILLTRSTRDDKINFGTGFNTSNKHKSEIRAVKRVTGKRGECMLLHREERWASNRHPWWPCRYFQSRAHAIVKELESTNLKMPPNRCTYTYIYMYQKGALLKASLVALLFQN